MATTSEGIVTLGVKPQSKRQRIDILFAQMETERESFISHWRDLNDFVLPRRGRFFISDANRGDRRTRRIIDSTATLASRTLSAGLMGGVTSPSRPWFRLSTPDMDLSELGDVKIWLEMVTRRIQAVFLRSNLYQTLPITYKDMGTFATGAIFIEEDFDTVIRTFPLPIGSYMIANDEKLQVRVFAREFRMTVRQIVEKFARQEDGAIDWTNISTRVKSQWDSEQKEQWIDVIHFVGPNPEFDRTRIESKFKRYESVYYERGANESKGRSVVANIEDRGKFLSESGYDFFPVLVPRWEITGEDVYGTDCPGMTALGDIRQLQLGEKRAMQAVEKMVNPPMKGPTHLRTKHASILPGAMTYTDDRDGQQGFRPVHDVDPRILELENKQRQVRDRIRSAYFVDLFLATAASDRREVTAREIEERHEEKLVALGSVLERLNQDLLDPLIDLTFNVMLRQGLIPPPPPELPAGLNLRVEYVSIMAVAQKLAGIGSIERFAGFAGQVAQANAAVLDKVDWDQMMDEYGNIIGVPASLIVPDEDVAEIRAERARADQAKQTLENALTAARTTKNLGESKVEEDNVLGKIDAATAGGTAE